MSTRDEKKLALLKWMEGVGCVHVMGCVYLSACLNSIKTFDREDGCSRLTTDVSWVQLVHLHWGNVTKDYY